MEARKTVTRVWRSWTGAAALLALIAAGGCKEGRAPSLEPATVPAPTEPAPVVEPAGLNETGAVVIAVDGRQLTRTELDLRMERLLAARGMGRLNPEMLAQLKPRLRQEIVQLYVTESLLINAADRQDVQVTDEEVTEAVDKIRQRAPTPEAFEDMLATFRMSETEMHDSLRRELRINKLLEANTPEVSKPDAAEVRAYYDERQAELGRPETVRARHILVKCDRDASDEERAEKRAAAERYREEALTGTNFAAVARAHSDCPSAAEGGDLGEFPRGRMVKAFEDAAFTQEVGKVGSVIETDFGYHIVRVEERNPARTPSLEEASERIESVLQSNKRRELVNKYLTRLREAADIRYTP